MLGEGEEEVQVSGHTCEGLGGGVNLGFWLRVSGGGTSGRLQISF